MLIVLCLHYYLFFATALKHCLVQYNVLKCLVNQDKICATKANSQLPYKDELLIFSDVFSVFYLVCHICTISLLRCVPHQMTWRKPGEGALETSWSDHSRFSDWLWWWGLVFWMQADCEMLCRYFSPPLIDCSLIPHSPTSDDQMSVTGMCNTGRKLSLSVEAIHLLSALPVKTNEFNLECSVRSCLSLLLLYPLSKRLHGLHCTSSALLGEACDILCDYFWNSIVDHAIFWIGTIEVWNTLWVGLTKIVSKIVTLELTYLTKPHTWCEIHSVVW